MLVHTVQNRLRDKQPLSNLLSLSLSLSLSLCYIFCFPISISNLSHAGLFLFQLLSIVWFVGCGA